MPVSDEHAWQVKRLDGIQDEPLNTTESQTIGGESDALIELVLLSRTKYFIGTRYSTYSMLIAAMRPEQKHWMVYPAVHDGCVQASSPYNSLSHFDRAFLTGNTFSIHGQLGVASCINQVCTHTV